MMRAQDEDAIHREYMALVESSGPPVDENDADADDFDFDDEDEDDDDEEWDEDEDEDVDDGEGLLDDMVDDEDP